MSYLEKFLPFVSSLGAEGLLIEYEDTFPFHGKLEVLRSKSFFYSRKQVEKLALLAASLNLEVIPLVQTFGHMEFVLEHEEFVGLREDENVDWSVCPLRNTSLRLIRDMIDQVCKEVFHRDP